MCTLKYCTDGPLQVLWNIRKYISRASKTLMGVAMTPFDTGLIYDSIGAVYHDLHLHDYPVGDHCGGWTCGVVRRGEVEAD